MKRLVTIIAAGAFLLSGCTEEIDTSAPSQNSEAPQSEAESGLTSEQENAAQSAENYLDMTGFSKEGLVKQLDFEGYSKADALAAIKTLDVDWKTEAAEKAQDYLDMSGFSKEGLREQLDYEGFTKAEISFAIEAVY